MSMTPATPASAPAAVAEIRTEELVKSYGPRNVVNGISLKFTAG